MMYEANIKAFKSVFVLKRIVLKIQRRLDSEIYGPQALRISPLVHLQKRGSHFEHCIGKLVKNAV
jgi:hypothetical protein